MKIYIVDAFAERLFTGNPAAVCVMDEWLSPTVMQQIAFENNLAETAFAVREIENYHIRWFTPVTEVDLCGHATMATAHVLFRHLGHAEEMIRFRSRSGILTVTRKDGLLTLDFPIDEIREIPLTNDLMGCFRQKPIAAFRGKTDYMLVFRDQATIESLSPDYQAIEQLEGRGLIATAAGDKTDFVSRFFAPQSGIKEDPVTGSAHTTLMPYWSSKLGKLQLSAAQLSERGGLLQCELKDDRVLISGKALTYLEGNINI